MTSVMAGCLISATRLRDYKTGCDIGHCMLVPDRGRMLQVKPGALINPDEMPVSTA